MLKALLLGGVTVDHGQFARIDARQKPFLQQVLEGQDLAGHLLVHKWELAGKDCSYFGRVLDRLPSSKNKPDRFVISYWGGDEDSSEDCEIPVHSLIVDLVDGDLSFDL